MSNSKQRDIFICHASEDKEAIVRPMVDAFDQARISYWYDEAEINWGDSVTEKVNKGLSTSRYVIVVFSAVFLQKNWPQRELNAVLNMEASTGEVKVLPLLVGSEQEKTKILSRFPLLNDKRYLPWDGGLEKVVKALLSRLGTQSKNGSPAPSIFPDQSIDTKIPLPKIKKKFTQRDKDIFLKDSFDKIRSYFQGALSHLQAQYSDVETDLTEIHKLKFTCTIYLHGDVANKCKIWVGGPLSSDSIAYYEGDFDQDGSCNDWLTISDEGADLGLKPAGFGFVGPDIEKDKALSPEKAAEYFWLRFTECLKY